jgi:uncharacterized protein (TIGR03382 family)
VARAHVAHPAEIVAPTVVRGVHVDDGAGPILAYRVTVAADVATWDVGVDAATGAILWARDRNVRLDGTGLVYDMSPVAQTGDTSITDGNDAASTTLNNLRLAVTLPRLDGTTYLRGPWVDSRPSNVNNRATSANHTFNYDRADDRFEEVMVYYHIDRAQARIQALGFTDINNRVQVAIVNGTTQDNSWYTPSTKQLTFGTGGVDDAEDADIILHEYGHSIHDNQVPGWGSGGNAGHMGEGWGDYLAASFGATLPQAAGHAQLAQMPCVGDWDAISYDNRNPPCLRRVDGTKHFPERYVNQVHTDGEMWSATLWDARTALGADVLDSLVLESHFLLPTNATFNTAATALLTADTNLYGGSHRAAMLPSLYKHGMLRTVQPPASYPDVVGTETVSIDYPAGAANYTNNLDNTQVYTSAGASALRLRFATIDTETGAGTSCAGGFCDAIYLFDGAGNLYQILGGAQTNVTTVQIPGDTVRIRLVTNGSGVRTGYVVDRVERMGSGTPPVPDAEPPTPDADPGDPDAEPVDPGAPDAGDVAARPDAGTPTDGEDGGGCGCGATGGAGPGGALTLVAALVALRRRRRGRAAA